MVKRSSERNIKSDSSYSAKLRLKLNPATIMLNESHGILNINIDNLGADIAESVSCEIKS